LSIKSNYWIYWTIKEKNLFKVFDAMHAKNKMTSHLLEKHEYV